MFCVDRIVFVVELITQLKAVKSGNKDYSYNDENYKFGPDEMTGGQTIYKSQIGLDLKSPSHCLLEEKSRDLVTGRVNCSVFPIYLDKDIRTVSIKLSTCLK